MAHTDCLTQVPQGLYIPGEYIQCKCSIQSRNPGNAGISPKCLGNCGFHLRMGEFRLHHAYTRVHGATATEPRLGGKAARARLLFVHEEEEKLVFSKVFGGCDGHRKKKRFEISLIMCFRRSSLGKKF